MLTNEILEQIKNESKTLNATAKYQALLNKQPLDKKPLKITYSEETKALFKQYKEVESEQKKATKQQAEKKIGSANQRRGNGRGCM